MFRSVGYISTLDWEDIMYSDIFPIVTIFGGVVLTYINYIILRQTIHILKVNIEIAKLTEEIRNLTRATLNVTIDVKTLSKDLLDVTKQLKDKV